ncbi:CBS domain-containing protein [Halobacillus alkaliphilus]|uniref:CBS domain-containing protein n=1 Tax=Halobacillus alkaliphilus TaxID=396056 RepID=A0A1I2Q098_9BACI|nr:CBS domain-containing protein [Halobacillus alkaliphilus]SFG21093.1 CBS domain-containing protein [Halobacillus alkaliphilus]
MTALKEYMNANLTTCEASDNLSEVAKCMREEDVGFVPIVEEGKYAGVVTDRDIVVKGLAKGSPDDVKASDIMTEKIITGSSDMEIAEAARLMQDHQIRRLLVVDQDTIRGVVSIGDIGKQGSDEIAGNIMSETAKGSSNN